MVRHGSHVVGGRRHFAAEGGHFGIVAGSKVADRDAHGAITQQFVGRIVIRGGCLQDVTRREFVTALLDKQFYGHGLEKTFFINLGIQRGDGFLS